MNPAAGESPVPSPLDKPLGELTEDDVAQLTREDCRRFLKQKGMRRPSWNKSQAIQQVISLKALLDSHRDLGDGILMKKDSLPTPPPPLAVAVTTPQVPVASPYRRKDPSPNPNPNPNRLTFGSRTTGVADAVAACVSTNPPESQMTIFYGGRVIVYNDVPAEKARALMQLAATPEPGPAYPNLTSVVPCIGPGPVPMPGKPVPSLRDNVNWSLARESEPEGPTNRQASLQRYREKRKDRYKGKKITGDPSSPSMDMMYLSQKFCSQTPNEQASGSDTSSPTQPRPPPTPMRCSSIEKQSQKLRFFVDLNDDDWVDGGSAPGQLNLDESPSWGSRSVDCFEKLEQIGEGTYGQVYMAKEIRTGEIVALKKIRMDNEREGFPITAIREIKILKKLHHENVIQLKEIVTSPGPEKDEQGRPGSTDGNKYKASIYMVFEYMDHDLTGLSDRPGLRFTVPQIKLLTGLHYCHVNQVLHRDIKGSNLLIDNEGNLKLADFGLARSFASDHNGNLTNRVITLWYRPPELLLGTTKYGPAVDMWSVGCIFAELLYGKPILPGKNEPEQLTKIFEFCGTPDEINWPGVSKIPWYNNFKPAKPMKRRVREIFKHFDRHALELLERMLTLDPSQRISAKDALDAEYFWNDPLPCDPKSLPKYESSHEFQTKKKRQQQKQHEEMAKRRKLQHPQPHARLPPIQQTGGQSHPQIRPGPSQPIHNPQPQMAAGDPGHHYGKPRGPGGGPNRYPQGGNPSGGYNPNHPNRGSQGGGGYNSGPYPPQGCGPPYAGSGMPGQGGLRGGAGGGGYGAPNYPQGAPFGGSGAGRGQNMGNNRNQQYSWQ